MAPLLCVALAEDDVWEEVRDPVEEGMEDVEVPLRRSALRINPANVCPLVAGSPGTKLITPTPPSEQVLTS